MPKISLDSEKFRMQVELVEMINESLDRRHDFWAQADPKLLIEAAETPNLGGKIAALEPRGKSLEEIKKAIGIEKDDKKLRKFLNKFFENKVLQSTKKVGRRCKNTNAKKAGRPPIIYDATPESLLNTFIKMYSSKYEELSDIEKELTRNALVIIGYEDKIKNIRLAYLGFLNRMKKELQERNFDRTSVLKEPSDNKQFKCLANKIFKNNLSNGIKKPSSRAKINKHEKQSLERMVDFVMLAASLRLELESAEQFYEKPLANIGEE